MAHSRPPFLLSLFLLSLFASGAIGSPGHHGPANHNYRDALSKSILFFEGQRSGRLPANQRMTWRRNSGLSDGSAMNASALDFVLLLVLVLLVGI